jgi:hypothetical protein
VTAVPRVVSVDLAQRCWHVRRGTVTVKGGCVVFDVPRWFRQVVTIPLMDVSVLQHHSMLSGEGRLVTVVHLATGGADHSNLLLLCFAEPQQIWWRRGLKSPPPRVYSDGPRPDEEPGEPWPGDVDGLLLDVVSPVAGQVLIEAGVRLGLGDEDRGSQDLRMSVLRYRRLRDFRAAGWGLFAVSTIVMVLASALGHVTVSLPALAVMLLSRAVVWTTGRALGRLSPIGR